jgi:cytidine deaminase
LSDSDAKPPSGWTDRREHHERRDPRRAGARKAYAHDERRSGGDRRDEDAWSSLELTLADEAITEASLVAAATDARTRAQARYSGFKVGAALETDERAVITGCNIENATYGLTLCAERVALVKALSEGRTRFSRIAVVADTEAPTPPCGPCRQLLWEYCGDIEVILANLERTTATLRLATLLPMPFDGRLLE